MQEVVHELTSTYAAEIQKILNTKKAMPQVIFSSFARSTKQPNLSSDQMVKGFVNILFSQFPKQEVSSEKRQKLMLLLSEYPNKYNAFIEQFCASKSKAFMNIYWSSINAIVPIKKEDLGKLLFTLFLGKMHIFNVLDKIILKNNLSILERQKLDTIIKEIKSKFDLLRQ